MKETEINDDTLALDLIDEIGPDGQYLDNPHTMKHFRKRWYPNLFDRSNYDGWQKKGGKSLGERASVQVEKILAEHVPEPLPSDIANAVNKIVKAEKKDKKICT